MDIVTLNPPTSGALVPRWQSRLHSGTKRSITRNSHGSSNLCPAPLTTRLLAVIPVPLKLTTLAPAKLVPVIITPFQRRSLHPRIRA